MGGYSEERVKDMKRSLKMAAIYRLLISSTDVKTTFKHLGGNLVALASGTLEGDI